MIVLSVLVALVALVRDVLAAAKPVAEKFRRWRRRNDPPLVDFLQPDTIRGHPLPAKADDATQEPVAGPGLVCVSESFVDPLTALGYAGPRREVPA